MFEYLEPYLPVLAGAIGGVLLGLAARLGRFCTLGAVEDLLYQGSDHRLRMWGVAIGVAITATFALAGLGFVDLGAAPYFATGWNPLAHAVGGLMFGVG
ncbi:MAG: YeeE/YedE thiosulfate transporter family protein, partial [Pseudomonadota bacterium]